MADNRTVLVKKSDGTFVRVPLSDIQKKNSSPGAVTNPSVQTINAPVPTPPSTSLLSKAVRTPPDSAEHRPAKQVNSKTKPQPQHLPNATSVVKKRAAAPAPVITKDDARSLLAETLPVVDPGASTTSDARTKQVDEVLSLLTFQVAREHTNRLRTVVQLFLKDVRTVDQTRDTLLRPVLAGGLGFNERQTEEVIAAADEVLGRLMLPVVETQPVRLSPPKPITAPQAIPAPAAVNTAFRSELERITKTSDDTSVADLIAVSRPVSIPKAPETLKPQTPFSLRPAAPARPPVHDIVTRPVTMGPLDEIRFLTVTDFRHLSSNPDEAASRVRQKFMTLKEESILLFLDALVAWRTSPLYLEYIAAVSTALGSGQKMPLMNTDKKNLQWPEIKAIVNMEVTLAV